MEEILGKFILEEKKTLPILYLFYIVEKEGKKTSEHLFEKLDQFLKLIVKKME